MLGWTVCRKDWTKEAIKPSPLSPVSWYSGWGRFCRATFAAQTVFGGTDWARQSPSSITPTRVPSPPALPRHLQPLILSHKPMVTGERSGPRRSRLMRRSLHGTGSVVTHLEARQKKMKKKKKKLKTMAQSFEGGELQAEEETHSKPTD